MKKYTILLFPAGLFPVALLICAFLLISAGHQHHPVPAEYPIQAEHPVPDTYILSKAYAVTIDGTSNLRDWQETVGQVTGSVVANVNGDGSVDLQSIRIKMEVLSIKSDMGRVMDNKTYDALKAAAHPDILFTLNVPVKLMQVRGGQNAVSIKGALVLAGISRPVVMQVRTFAVGREKLQFEGSQTIKMTDYGVRPPSALFGTMKAAPAITIHFKTSFINQANINKT
jgi:polyisoprenoid-binding protein YceI